MMNEFSITPRKLLINKNRGYLVHEISYAQVPVLKTPRRTGGEFFAYKIYAITNPQPSRSLRQYKSFPPCHRL